MITTSMDHYRVQPGSRVDLAKWDADDKSVFDGSKKDAPISHRPASTSSSIWKKTL